MIFERFISGNGRNPEMKEIVNTELKDRSVSRRCPPAADLRGREVLTALGEGLFF